jgi:hypothetical protein
MDRTSDSICYEDSDILQEEPEKHLIDDSHVFQPSGVRRSFCFNHEVDRLIPDNRYHLLFHFNFLFLLILSAFKKI